MLFITYVSMLCTRSSARTGKVTPLAARVEGLAIARFTLSCPSEDGGALRVCGGEGNLMHHAHITHPTRPPTQHTTSITSTTSHSRRARGHAHCARSCNASFTPAPPTHPPTHPSSYTETEARGTNDRVVNTDLHLTTLEVRGRVSPQTDVSPLAHPRSRSPRPPAFLSTDGAERSNEYRLGRTEEVC
jgi:hypothetical protein